MYVGDSFYLNAQTPAADISVMAVNNDFFDLTGGVSYDFGVNFYYATPTGGINSDYCSMVVQIVAR